MFTLDPWRIVKEGATKVVDINTCYWCPRHIKEGFYDGMYVTHPPEKHNEWMDRKINWGKKKSSKDSTTSSGNLTTDKKLGLSTDLKATMVASFQCTQEEMDKLWSDAVQNSALN